MTDKERLEAAKLMAKMLRLETRLPYDFPFDLVDWLIEQAERVQELESEIENWQKGRFLAVSTFIKEIDLKKRVQELEELVYKTQTDFLNANKHRNIYKEQNKRYKETIENIKKYNQKALKVGDYTESEALLDISLEIMKLEGEE